MPTSEWVNLTELKNDQSLDAMATTRDDASLLRDLEAAMDWVEDHRPDLSYLGAHTVPRYVRLGTLRLAARWFVRRSSPTGMLDLGEGGAARVPYVDPDIYNQLGIMGGFS